MSEEELVNIPTITIKGKGNYTGTQTIHFNIHPQDISKSEDGMKYSYKNGLVYNKGKNRNEFNTKRKVIINFTS